MKESDKKALKLLCIFGSIILAGGVGMGATFFIKTHCVTDTVAGFVAGSICMAFASYLISTRE